MITLGGLLWLVKAVLIVICPSVSLYLFYLVYFNDVRGAIVYGQPRSLGLHQVMAS